MENASKALLMAGGVLIAIIIISLLVKTYGNIGAFQKQQISAEEAERIEAYNKEYTKYLNQYVYGTEVVTVVNCVANYQEKTNNAFTINITFKETYTYKLSNGKEYTTKGTLKLKGDEDIKYQFIDSYSNKDSLYDLKNRAFKCTAIGYDSYGKVNSISFEEKQIT